MSRETKTKTYEVITCDFCGEDMEKDFIETCPVCNKDICSSCSISMLKGKKLIEKICPDCFSQAMHGLVAKKVKEIVDKLD